MANTYSAGIVTAYGAAVRGGYTGTYEEFCAQQAAFAENAEQVAEDRAAVEQIKTTFENQTVPAAVQQVNQAGTAQVQAVQAAGDAEERDIAAAGAAQETRVLQAGADQEDAVNAAGSTQVQAVQTAGAAQVTAVQDAGTTQVAAVNAAGATQVDAVEDKGEEVLASIPQDYSALSGEVDDLKSATLDGVETFGLNYTFIRAYITNNGLIPIGYRVSSESLMVYDRDITVTIASGFRMGYHKYNSDGSGHVAIGWQTGTYTIPKNQYFRVEIARVTENTSETADIAEFVSKITFASSLQTRFESVAAAVETVENMVKGFAENRVLYSADSISLSGSGQFVTKDIDVPVEEFGAYYNVLVGSVENVSVPKPVRYRFLDAGGSVINPDKYNAAGVVGTLVAPSNAAKLRLTLYATMSGGLTGNAYFKDVAIWVGNPADVNIESAVSENTFAQRMTIEGHALLPDNPLMPSYAHKGYALTAPECTGAAMIEAKRRGFTGVENDTQLTSDGQIVMWHDDTLSKLGDSSHGIGDYTLAQLKAMDFGSWKASKYANERILTFAEWVLLCKNLGLKINVDTKFEWTESQAASLAQTVIDYGMADNCVWNINFNGGYTSKLIELIPNATLNYIATATAERCAILQSIMSEHPSISIQLTPELSQLTAADVARAHSYGIKQFFYTNVDVASFDPESYKAYMDDVLELGVDGGVTDIYRIVDIANMQLL